MHFCMHTHKFTYFKKIEIIVHVFPRIMQWNEKSMAERKLVNSQIYEN
jgi:hypothetical protein